jgi:hypothetical protein
MTKVQPQPLGHLLHAGKTQFYRVRVQGLEVAQPTGEILWF